VSQLKIWHFLVIGIETFADALLTCRVPLGTTLTNRNSIQEEIKSRFQSGNACYHSVQNLLSSNLLPKNLKIKIYRTLILPIVFMGVKLGR